MSGRYGKLGRPLTAAEVDHITTAVRRLKALREEVDVIVADVEAYTNALVRRERLQLVEVGAGVSK